MSSLSGLLGAVPNMLSGGMQAGQPPTAPHVPGHRIVRNGWGSGTVQRSPELQAQMQQRQQALAGPQYAPAPPAAAPVPAPVPQVQTPQATTQPAVPAPKPPAPAPVQKTSSAKMTKTAKMSKASEGRLLNALEHIAELTNSGEHPDDAIAKVASDLAIPAGHIHLLAAAYNTGRTTKQRNEGKDVWEKAATFPLADTTKIISRMFPTREEKQAEVIEVSSDYDMRPERWLTKLAEKKRLEEARNTKLPPLVDKPLEPLPRDHDFQFRKKAGTLERATKAAKEARALTKSAFDKANGLSVELGELFKRGGCPPFTEVRDNSVRLYGDTVLPLFNFIAEEYPQLTKQASRRPQPAIGKAYELVREAIQARTEFETAKANFETKEAAAAQADKDYKDFLNWQYPEQPKHPILGTPLEKLAGLTTALGSMAANRWNEHNKPMQQAVAESMIKKPGLDPQLENEARALQQRSVIQNLLADTQGQDPHKVISAYRGIADIAPNAAAKSMLAKDFVHRSLAGGQLSYFDLDALTKIEKNLADLAQPQKKPV